MVQIYLITAALMCGAEPTSSGEAWFHLYDRTAGEYDIFRGGKHDERLELQTKPVYKWSAASAGGASGAVYVWTRHGCAEAVACFWGVARANGGSTVAHELHSLSPVMLDSRRPGPNEWHPTGKLDRHRIEDAPEAEFEQLLR
ncbi:MAG TPA: hypothetical protein PK867_28475, partial [Pirellulales bacterium]|nr:hypothetical protein [Pirellulales bacterium]